MHSSEKSFGAFVKFDERREAKGKMRAAWSPRKFTRPAYVRLIYGSSVSGMLAWVGSDSACQ